MSTSLPVWRLTHGAQALVLTTFFVVFFIAGLFYFFQFSSDLDRYLYTDPFFGLALNSHDHLVYVEYIDTISQFGIEYGMNNDFGIASIYLVLASIFPQHWPWSLIAFVFNSVIFLGCYVLWVRIADYYRLGLYGKLIFFVNTSFLYFMQLINKDMLTIFFFLLTIHWTLVGKQWRLVLLLPVMFLVRQQMAVFLIAYLFFLNAQRPLWRIAAVYTVTSFTAAFLSVHAPLIGEATMGEGFGAFLISFNVQHYYLGYFLFNPVRVLQFIVDAYSSFLFFTESGNVDVAKILRLPVLVLLATLARPLLSLAMDFRKWLRTPLQPLALAVAAYLLAWLMNPTINARYVVLITPVLLLFALSAKATPLRGHCGTLGWMSGARA